jgi:calcineurin-like phosphoesterase
VVDFHAEATSEKQALAYHLDGRVSCVIGTHTHAPTADERLLPGGTAFISDVGMCGDYNSVLGMDPSEPINRFLTKIARSRFEPATGPATLSGVVVDIDRTSALATSIRALRLGGVLAPSEPLGSN